MRINIYQIDSDKDTNRVKFEGYEETLKYGGIDPAKYKCVFRGDVDGDLEAVYCLFNLPNHPGTFQGHSLSLSDIIEVVETDANNIAAIDLIDTEEDGTPYVYRRIFFTSQDEFEKAKLFLDANCSMFQAVDLDDQKIMVEPGCYFVDHIGFKKVAFDSSQCAEMDGVRMLMIQPHRTPIVTYVKDELDDLQRAVSDHGEDALIEFTYPFDDDCIMLGNEEAKLNGMEGNRRLGDSIYAGPLFVTRDNGVGGLCSITDEQVIKYSEMFAEPQDISPEETQADVGFTLFGWDW